MAACAHIPGKVSGRGSSKAHARGAIVFENLEDGMAIDEGLEQFPVARKQQSAEGRDGREPRPRPARPAVLKLSN